MSVAACSLWAGAMSRSAKQGNLLCAIAQRLLWVCDGMGYSGSQCCLLTSSYKDQELAGIYSSHPAWWGLLLSSPMQRGGGGNAMACGPHADCPPAPDWPWTLQRGHWPCGGLAGASFLPPARECRPSLPETQPSCLAYVLGFSKFLPHFCPGMCCCSVAPTQDVWSCPGGWTGTRWEVHPKPGPEWRGGPAWVSRSHCKA